jgi:Holliday junction resolvase RusA-like endonuclease
MATMPAAQPNLATEPRNRAAEPPAYWQVTIPLQPVAKARPRITPAEYEYLPDGRRRKVRGAHGYTPPDTAEYELKVRWYLRQAKIPRLDGDLAVTVIFSYVPVRGKPRGHDDLDNYLKALFDATNTIGWKDDRQVVSVHAWLEKVTESPRIYFHARMITPQAALPVRPSSQSLH